MGRSVSFTSQKYPSLAFNHFHRGATLMCHIVTHTHTTCERDVVSGVHPVYTEKIIEILANGQLGKMCGLTHIAHRLQLKIKEERVWNLGDSWENVPSDSVVLISNGGIFFLCSFRSEPTIYTTTKQQNVGHAFSGDSNTKIRIHIFRIFTRYIFSR